MKLTRAVSRGGLGGGVDQRKMTLYCSLLLASAGVEAPYDFLVADSCEPMFFMVPTVEQRPRSHHKLILQLGSYPPVSLVSL